MRGLRDMLLEEEKRLENIIHVTQERLENVPEGRLRISCVNNQPYYYHCTETNKQTGKYIAKENRQLVQRLAQKTYDKKVLKLAEKRLSQIKSITRDYEDAEIEKIYKKERRERQRFIQPVELIWEQKIERWMQEKYEGKMDDPDYARKAIKKIEVYGRNDICPGKNLILTYETKQTVLSNKTIEKMVKQYLI